jgi:hypothetical protein
MIFNIKNNNLIEKSLLMKTVNFAELIFLYHLKTNP